MDITADKIALRNADFYSKADITILKQKQVGTLPLQHAVSVDIMHWDLMSYLLWPKWQLYIFDQICNTGHLWYRIYVHITAFIIHNHRDSIYDVKNGTQF